MQMAEIFIIYYYNNYYDYRKTIYLSVDYFFNTVILYILSVCKNDYLTN